MLIILLMLSVLNTSNLRPLINMIFSLEKSEANFLLQARNTVCGETPYVSIIIPGSGQGEWWWKFDVGTWWCCVCTAWGEVGLEVGVGVMGV